MAAANWLPGSVERVFGIEGESGHLLQRLAIKEAVAIRAVVPPRTVEWDGVCARSSASGRTRLSSVICEIA